MEETRYKIGLACVGCGSCVHVCPEGAIGGEMAPLKIDRERCTGCGLCAGTCPVLAIKAESGKE